MRFRDWLAALVVVLAVVVGSSPIATESPPQDVVEITNVAESPGTQPDFEPTFIARLVIERVEQAVAPSSPVAIAAMAMVAKTYSVRIGAAMTSRTHALWISEVMPAQGPAVEFYDPRPRFGRHMRT